MAESPSFTSSSLNGLMIASTFFMDVPPSRGADRPPYARGGTLVKIRSRRYPSVRSRARAEHVCRLAVLREVESGVFVVLLHPEPAAHHARYREAHEGAHDGDRVGDERGDELRG